MANIQPTETPEELLRMSIKGDRKSQEKLYRTFYGFAMSTCMRYTKSRDEALEVVNDGFLKVFTKGEQYDPKYPFKAWFRRIIVNTALDFYRSQQKHYFHENIEEAYEVIDAIARGDEGLTGKPTPAIFLEAAKRMNTPAENCIVFEDAPFGIEAARRAGMRAVAICTGHTAAELAGPHVIASVANYNELLNANFLENLHVAA